MEVENGTLYRMMDIDMNMADHFKRTPACWGRSNLCCEPLLGLLFAWPCERRRTRWRPLHSPSYGDFGSPLLWLTPKGNCPTIYV